MASNSGSSIGTVLGIGAVLFIVYLLWPRNTAANQQQQLKNAQQNSLLSSLMKALFGGQPNGANALGGGGVPAMPMGGLLGPGQSSYLGQFLGAINNIGLTPSDWFGASSSTYSTPALDNYQLPTDPTQLLDLSGLNQPITSSSSSSSLSDPIVDPSSGLNFGSFSNGGGFDPTSFTSMDGGGYQFG